jgi:hypothetical protein
MTETPVLEQPEAQAGSPVANYWGVDSFDKWYLPDGVQYFQFKIMNEGEKVQFEKLTNNDLVVNRDQSARVKVDPSAARHALIKTCVNDWHLFAPDATGQLGEAKFAKPLLEKWLTVADPKIVEELEFAIRMANPWMQSEMSVEEIDKEIDRLHDVRKQLIEKAAGEASSATK